MMKTRNTFYFGNSQIVLFVLLFSMGCTKSPSGTVEELIKTRQPTFSGQTSRLFTTPSAAFVLNGECDPISYGLEYSINEQSTWIDIPASCPNGSFTLNFTLTRQLKVYVRSRTKTGQTPSSLATIRLVLPPVSPYLKLVNSGQASDEAQLGTQNEMSDTTAQTMTNGLHILKSTLVDIIYEN